MIFSSHRALNHLVWDDTPVGVFPAESPDRACQAAAAASGRMGTFFAVEGRPWGVEMESTLAQPLGSKASAEERLHAILDKLEMPQPQLHKAQPEDIPDADTDD